MDTLYPGSRLQPDKLLPKLTNATDRASTTKARPHRPANAKCYLCRFFTKGGPFPAAASLLLLITGGVGSNTRPHCYACGNLVHHVTPPLCCFTAKCPSVSCKQITFTDLHHSSLLNRWQCPAPSHGGPKATQLKIPANNNPLRQLPISFSPRHQAPRLRCPCQVSHFSGLWLTPSVQRVHYYYETRKRHCHRL